MASNGIEDEFVYAGKALPTPTDTPYRTPSRSMSRRSSRYGTSSPGPSSSPPPFPPDQLGHAPSDAANDDNISILDPRRFTPTLHASLVSEILSLRRELESRSGLVESLENSLQATRNDHDRLDETLVTNSKETRSLRRQLQLLEGGTSSALGELAKERDEAVDNVTELKKRLDTSNKRVHAQDRDAEQLQEMWEEDKGRWDNERRALERRVHISEGRLKAVVDEVAAHQAAMSAQPTDHPSDAESVNDEAVAENGIAHDHDANGFQGGHRKGLQSLSSLSNDDLQSVRSLAIRGPKGGEEARSNGLSLADELAMDGDVEDTDEEDDAEDHETAKAQTLADEVLDQPPAAVKQHRSNDTSGQNAMQEAVKGGDVSAGHPFANAEALVQSIKQTPIYVDTGIQFSPPPSPMSPTQENKFLEEAKAESTVATPMEIEANQRRKRVAMGSPVGQAKEQTRSTAASPESVPTSSHSSHEPLSPPNTPKVPDRAPPPPPPPPPIQMVSSSTQTELPEPPKRSPFRSVPVPSINIRPPTPGSSIQRKPVLPPQTKSVACQATVELPRDYRSVTVQTEGIRVEKRALDLPPNLPPLPVPSGPRGPETEDASRSQDQTISNDSSKGRWKNPPPSVPLTTSPPASQANFLWNNDTGPLRSGKTNRIRRPFRSSSLFAGFDAPSSDEADDYDKTVNEDHYHTPLSAPKPPSKTKAENHGQYHAATGAVDRPSQEFSPLKRGLVKGDGPGLGALPTSPEKRLKHLNQRLTVNTGKQPNIRKSALITSGTAAHVQRARSPSLGDRGKHGSGVKDPVPPFPVPTRSSSRKVSLSSDGTGSPTFRKGVMPSNHARRESGRASFQKRGLRKVRSAAAISGVDQLRRPRSRSPPPMSASTVGSDVPKLPPIPHDEILTPLYAHERKPFTHQHQFSTNTSTTADASAASSNQITGVVDAIAQTMVGEWMWKYVRRRKSFGVSDSPHVADGKTAEDTSVNISSNGIRHKRWVWLAPYERTVMWSSKQPTSGTALLGKSGRKLTIQSVLDVKDDTPGPKNAGSLPIFNRSILILTSARALKFTASSKERHYLWLMALSFLSDSSQGANELASLPPVPHRECEPPPGRQVAGLRRNPIKDSIRIAKGKARPSSRSNATPAILPRTQANSLQPAVMPAATVHAASVEEPVVGVVADPPNVPRFSAHHNRKRSNTGSWLPASAFRSHPSSNYSVGTNGSSDLYGAPSHTTGGGGGGGVRSIPSSFSGRTSEVSGRSSVMTPNFFDAVGTVRMEAFVQRSTHAAFNEEDEHRRHRPNPSHRADGRWNGSMASNTPYDTHHLRFHHRQPPSLGDFQEHQRSDDPFRGF